MGLVGLWAIFGFEKCLKTQNILALIFKKEL